ncbi:MAG TPA: hypothetical protein VKT82_09205 [Ktedonobacterales bacterium]|nr:hypothetical protein [Ktedonobacterales bacterium]
MVFNGIVPWHDRPAREFPAQRWVRQTYAFSLPPLRFQQGWPLEREFPAKKWLREQQARIAEMSARA